MIACHSSKAARLSMVAIVALLTLAPATASGGNVQPYRLFPWLYFHASDAPEAQLDRPAYGPGLPVHGESSTGDGETADESERKFARLPIIAGKQVIAFYGKPGSVSMGILGEYSKENLAPLLEGYARLYDQNNGPLGVVPAFHIVYGTVWPEGEIGLLKSSVVEEYVKFAAERGWAVILDHQIGKYSVEEAVRALLPFLRYPNVHLALDPEWRTPRPMKEIGTISGDEINTAQKMIDDYLRDNGLPGIRLLVVHQFTAKMISGRESVRADFDRVVLVHNADGFGSPALKRQSYAFNALATNMPVKGFKLFFQSKVPGAGSDVPLMKPEDVLALDPLPLLIMYQ